MPGVASMVRRAYISIEGGPILQVWEPGDDVIDPPSGASFKLPAGAKLHLKVDYKKVVAGRAEGARRQEHRRPLLHGGAAVRQVDRICDDRWPEG
jgi:hypothetical protein